MIDLKQRLHDILQNNFVSDVHLTVGEPVWSRAMGNMQRDGDQLISDSDVAMLLRDFGINTPADKLAVPRMTGKDGEGFAVTFGSWRLRVDLVYANARRLAIVMRKLNSRMPTVEEIGLPNALIRQTDLPTGLVLITGATGSGKSTTLAALLELVNLKREGHIITVEDPVEYPICSKRCKVTTREIGLERDASSFDAALRRNDIYHACVYCIYFLWSHHRLLELVRKALEPEERVCVFQVSYPVLHSVLALYAEEVLELVIAYFRRGIGYQVPGKIAKL